MSLTTEVILCTFNGSKFIVEQLESIVAQTLPVQRISIHDDASDDDTVSVIEAFFRRTPDSLRPQVEIRVNAENIGYARNFSHAIQCSRGDVLFLCDQDDVWEVDKVEKLTSALLSHGVDMVFSDGSLISDDGRFMPGNVLAAHNIREKQFVGFREHTFARLVRHNFINGAALAIRQRAAIHALPLPCDMPHDYWLALWCAVHGGIAIVPERLYRYRQHSANVIGIGTDNVLYAVMGVWRHAHYSRDRDLRIWSAVTERLTRVSAPYRHITLAQQKLAWLKAVTSAQRSKLRRLLAICRSTLNGDYRRFASTDALWRDLLGVFK